MNKHVQNKNSLNRYLLCFHFNESIIADVLSFTATEHQSKPYKYMIKFNRTDKALLLDKVINTTASFLLREPGPQVLHHSEPVWDALKKVNGIINSFA
mgnify:CR=1 FL=1